MKKLLKITDAHIQYNLSTYYIYAYKTTGNTHLLDNYFNGALRTVVRGGYIDDLNEKQNQTMETYGI